MKANNKKIRSDTSAQVGIGTLIIFIAMVLVAAVAAAVLIQTSGTLQQKAQSTGKQATQEVSSNLMVKTIEGIRAKDDATTMADNISMLELKVGLNVGSSPVDVNQVVISITDGTTTNNLIYANNEQTYGNAMKDFSGSATAAANKYNMTTATQTTPGDNAKYFFTVEKIRDEDGSFSQAEPVMNTGDLVTFYISTVAVGDTAFDYIGSMATNDGQDDTGLVIGPRSVVNIVLTPESGAATTADFVTPSSYGIKENVQLYP
ncbi:archaellin/type IV pilin N-terminal domain-containing protein [Methanolobus bombayensis]|uniref:archaellin/type IV pilin N-terminal domain-containing protein n=1 Tax=Methanolobus bombayensis TaxID=38023 RepID=UPI001AE7B3FA|nr:archaellin/type IV pilin N-terminal domain-containing protein [Methanolobus bombayensis]MBP1910238.1 flagellin FlaB [Methanolobus bombayensis]